MKDVLIRLNKISKIYDEKYIIKNLSLDIYEGEFITLLGPSGCGKTTVLRMISGLEKVHSGRIYLEGKDITDMPPTDREVNTIFQNFALFPHMTVWENIYFGLKMKKTPMKIAKKRIDDAISLVKLNGYEKRYPRELSGGEQQRVAIARGIVMNHKVLLLDESLSSLDLKLKREMQIELKKIQKKLGMTFIYVTHDQDEALTMSDRIAIINKGNIEQLGTPKEIYLHPKTLFSADFIGESNILEAVVKKADKGYDTAIVEVGKNVELEIINNNYKVGQHLKLMIRPEKIKVVKNKNTNYYEGTVKEYLYDGTLSKLVIDPGIDIKDLKVTIIDCENYEINDPIYYKIEKEDVVVIGDNYE